MATGVLFRTVRPFSTAHTFCASREGPRNSGFLTAVLERKAYLGKAKLGITMHFSGIAKLKFGRGNANYCFLVISEKSVATPTSLFGFQQPLLRSAFPTKS